MTSKRNQNIIITRQTGGNDGFGAQYQRILGVYAISRALNISYMHTPFADIDYQGLQSLSKNEHSKEYVRECIKRTWIKSDLNPNEINKNLKDYGFINDKNTPNKTFFLENLIDVINKNQKTILQFTMPYTITDKFPEMYNYVRGLYKPIIKKNEIFTIGVHVRRGELFVVDGHRMLNNQYYVMIVNKIINFCNEMNIKFCVELYTEIPDKDMVITGGHVGINNRINEPITVKKELSSITEFENIPNLNKYINEATLDTFDRMVNCDILVMSRSSFSASAAYVKEGISVYYPFWSNMMKRDIAFNDPKFNDKIKLFLKKYI